MLYTYVIDSAQGLRKPTSDTQTTREAGFDSLWLSPEQSFWVSSLLGFDAVLCLQPIKIRLITNDGDFVR